jgi:hypothetical protein
MNRKLTLSVDEGVIERAKKHASKQKKSLSELVENYFRIITSNDKKKEVKYSSTVKELLGSIKVPDDFNYEAAKYDYLKQKHLHD